MFSFLINEQSWHTFWPYWQWSELLWGFLCFGWGRGNALKAKPWDQWQRSFFWVLLMNKSTWSVFPGFLGNFSPRERQISCFAELLHFFPPFAHFTDWLVPLSGLLALACSTSLYIFVWSASPLVIFVHCHICLLTRPISNSVIFFCLFPSSQTSGSSSDQSQIFILPPSLFWCLLQFWKHVFLRKVACLRSSIGWRNA